MPQCIPDDAINNTAYSPDPDLQANVKRAHGFLYAEHKVHHLKFHNIIAYVTQTSSHYTGWIQKGPWEHKRPQHQLLWDATVQECVKDRQVYQWCECLISDVTAYSIFKVSLCWALLCSHMQAHSLCDCRINTKRITPITWRGTMKGVASTRRPCMPWTSESLPVM